MHLGGNVEMHVVYTAAVVAKLVGIKLNDELFEGTGQWIANCQTYEGGFGNVPGVEAHGAFSFCAAAALALLGVPENVNLNSLLRWAVKRQMPYEGGFQGRPNKVVDSCYSFWLGSLVKITQTLIEKRTGFKFDDLLIHRGALQEYILICCQSQSGGIKDKPSEPEDLFHTCYGLSGLSIDQNSSADDDLLPTDPVCNIPPESINKATSHDFPQ